MATDDQGGKLALGLNSAQFECDRKTFNRGSELVAEHKDDMNNETKSNQTKEKSVKPNKNLGKSSYGEKVYECPVCRKKLFQLCDIKRHLLVHTGEKPHGCPECGKRFSLLQHLKRHLRTHLGDKPHECPECGEKFSRLDYIKSHILTHTGEKPHECSDCGQRFRHQISLNRHMLTHTGEQPHECPECGRKFSLLNNMKKHLQTHATESASARGKNAPFPALLHTMGQSNISTLFPALLMEAARRASLGEGQTISPLDFTNIHSTELESTSSSSSGTTDGQSPKL